MMKIFLVVFLMVSVAILLFLKGCPGSSGEIAEESVVTEVLEVIDPEAGVEESSEEALETLGVGVDMKNPAALMAEIAETIRAGDLAAFTRLIGEEGMTDEQAKRLAELIAGSGLSLRKENAVREVGELEINRRTRWALRMEEEGRRIFFDLVRKDDGKWKVERVFLPESLAREPGSPGERPLTQDALGISDSFLQAVLRQDFEKAKSYVAEDGVSDARIAGLCIIFEEGDYSMKKERPLRGLFNRGNAAGFLANVEDRGGEKAAQFGITLQREEEKEPWQIEEINLDQLLADYADRVAGGDVHYTPLLKNPNGGDTIVLYFDFDKEELEPRSERQLDIVVGLLKVDVKKKVRITGHTDGFGSAEYNRALSAKRAKAVKEFLIRRGLPEDQVVTEALGKTQPRLPNMTQTGEDNPDGRRVNRRTEIYLDF